MDRDITLTVDYATINAAVNNPLTREAYQVQDAGGNLPEERARGQVFLVDVVLTLPLAAAGIDIRSLLAGACEMERATADGVPFVLRRTSEEEGQAS